MPLLTKEYTDLNLSFTPHPVTGDIAKLTDYSAVKAAVKNLVLTNFYERPFQPSLGTGIQDTLFEPITAITAQKIQLVISNAIEQYEPRVTLTSVIVAVDADRNGYKVDIIFQIKNLADPVALSMFLERIR